MLLISDNKVCAVDDCLTILAISNRRNLQGNDSVRKVHVEEPVAVLAAVQRAPCILCCAEL